MGFHLVTDNYGKRDFVKRYSLDINGELSDDNTLYPYSLRTIKSYSEEELSLEIIYQTLTRNFGPSFAIMPNIGANPFQRTTRRTELYEGNNPLVEDEARSWIQFDIDWGYELRKGLHDMPHQIDLKDLAQFVLRELRLPPNLGYVAQRSSSAKVKKDELRIRIYVLLDKALDSNELLKTFSAYGEENHPKGYGIDLSMTESNRIHLVHEALIEDEGIEVFETKGSDVIIQNGPRLKIESLASPVEINRHSRIVSEGKNEDRKALLVVTKILGKQFKAEGLIPWNDQEKLYEAIEDHTKEHPEDWERSIRKKMIWWIIQYDLSRNGNADKALDLILDNDVIAPKDSWREKRIKDMEEHQRRYLLHKWGCGDIRNAFRNEECKLINSRDMGELSDEDIDCLPVDDSILVLWSACGTGKTKLAKRLFHRARPETSLSICYSKAAQLKNAEDFNQTFYLDSGKDVIPGLQQSDNSYVRDHANRMEWNDRLRKQAFMSIEDHLASTGQSIRFGRDKYDWVFIDEIEHCLEALHFKPSQEGGTDLASRLSENMTKLLDICSKAKFVMVADAKASDLVTGWFVEQIQSWPHKKKFLLENEWDWVQTMNLFELRDKAHCLQKITELVDEGKSVAVQVDFANGKEGEKPEMNRWRRAIATATGLKEGTEVVSRIASDFSDDEEAENRKNGIPTLRTNPNVVIKNMREEGNRVFLNSPWNQVAFSYEEEPYDATVNIYLANYNHAEDIEQGFRRWRRTEEHYFFISSRRNYFGKNDISESYDEIKHQKTLSKAQLSHIEIHSRLTNAYFMRAENPYAHFHLHMDAKGKNIEKLNPTRGLNKFQNILKESGKDAEEEAFQNLRQGLKSLNNFYLFGECVLEKVNIEDKASLTNEDLKRLASFNQNHCKALCERFLWDEIEARDCDQADSEKFYFLHWQLWNAAIDVLRPYINGKENHIFDWLISSERELAFHYDNTDESNKLKAFVKLNKKNLKNSLKSEWLTRMNKKWYETPSLLFEHIAVLLFLDCEKKEKNTKYSIPELSKELAKEYGITYRGRSTQAKKEIFQTLRKRKRLGIKLSLNERKYDSAISPMYVFRKRQFSPIQLVDALDEHHRKYREQWRGEEKNSNENLIS